MWSTITFKVGNDKYDLVIGRSITIKIIFISANLFRIKLTVDKKTVKYYGRWERYDTILSDDIPADMKYCDDVRVNSFESSVVYKIFQNILGKETLTKNKTKSLQMRQK